MALLGRTLKSLFVNNWKFVLDDNKMQFYINEDPVQLNMNFNSESFLEDQAQFIQDFIRAFKEAHPRHSCLLRPAITLELKGKLREYKNSAIFKAVFLVGDNPLDELMGRGGRSIGGRSLKIN